MNNQSQENAYQSESIDLLAVSLSKAQGKITVAIEDKKNPHFKSTYSSLNSIWDACRSALSEHGLSVTQIMQPSHSSIDLITILLHSSGQWIKSILPIPSLQLTPQQLGSAITYLRRYSLSAIVGVAPGFEDDGDSIKNEKIENNIQKNIQKIPEIKLSKEIIQLFVNKHHIIKDSDVFIYIDHIAKVRKISFDHALEICCRNEESFLQAFNERQAKQKRLQQETIQEQTNEEEIKPKM